MNDRAATATLAVNTRCLTLDQCAYIFLTMRVVGESADTPGNRCRETLRGTRAVREKQ